MLTYNFPRWAASRKKVPNVLSRCHTKSYDTNFLDSFSFFFFFNFLGKFCFCFFFSFYFIYLFIPFFYFLFLKSRCHTKRRGAKEGQARPRAPVLLLVWQQPRPWGTFLRDTARIIFPGGALLLFCHLFFNVEYFLSRQILILCLCNWNLIFCQQFRGKSPVSYRVLVLFTLRVEVITVTELILCILLCTNGSGYPVKSLTSPAYHE